MSENPTSRSEVDRRDLLGTATLAAAGTVAAVAGLAPATAHAQEQDHAHAPKDPLTRAGKPRGGTPSLRRPGRPTATAGPALKGSAEPLPSIANIALNRLAFGPRPGDVAAFMALPGNDLQKLTTWVDEQLNPFSIPETVLGARIVAAGFSTIGKSRTQLWTDHVVNGVDGSLPREEIIRLTWMRAVYSERQLLAVMTDFWHNHFNCNFDEYPIRSMLVHYDRDVIRANAFGNFRDLLELVATSTSMLYYLDNYTSSNAGPNENFCRELCELHTLGSEHYYGVIQQNQVPLDPNGVPMGYVDADVFEATRAFTGWTVSNSSSIGDTGEFFYRSEWHDRFQKNFVGNFLPQDQADLKDGRDVLDILAAHPGTGRHVARKLCTRLVSDTPSQSLIDDAAALFTAQVDAPDQLKQVVRMIILSDEFRNTWGEKTKRPFEIGASAIRACQGDFPFSITDSDTSSFLSRYNDAGQSLFRKTSPDGYPDTRAAWHSTTPRAICWRLNNWLIDVRDDNDVFRLNVLSQTPAGVNTATLLADFWIDRILDRPLSSEDRQDVIDFMGQGFNPDLVLPIDTSSSIQDRLRMMVGLIMNTPSFLLR